MALAARIVSLNLGSQSLGLATFRAQGNGGLVLEDFRRREMVVDPAADGDRSARLTTTLRAMMEELGLKHGPVDYAVSGQSVFARFVKLPPVDEEKVERIITFEAQQNVPFPIDEVIWDYQLVGADAESKIEVVLVAIKADLLEGINAAVEESGLETTLVDVATMALYNAFRFNYSELAGCSLLIDIGARTTNLLFVEPGKIFSRSIPIGGSTITSALAKEFNEPFAAAELRKTRDGFVSLGGAYAEASDPEVARVSKLVRNTMARLHAELARSISFYRAQQQGGAPARIYLCGGTTSTPYMREFFREKFQLPIEFFNPLRNVAVAETVALDAVAHSAHLLGELVGLALRSTITCPMELNLRPASVVRRHRLAQRRPFLIVAAACFLLGLLGWGFYFMRVAQVEAATSDQLQNHAGSMRALESQLAQSRKQIAALDAVAAPLLAEISARGDWLEILDDLNARLPKENIWITELAPTSSGRILGGKNEPGNAPAPTPFPTRLRGNFGAAAAKPMIDGVFVRGLYLSNPKEQEVVVDYFRNLLGSHIFAVDARDQSQVMKPSTPTQTEWAYPYELRLKLREPLPTPTP
ncbi:MAG TPA: type IV pilus assembly protein PilM [Chthoniobacterales bacterium]|jgi:type IV pilus assembly protein PilM